MTNLSRPVIEIIKERCSWRSYDGRPLAPDVKRDLEARLAAPPGGPFSGEVRLTLLDTETGDRERPLKLGTYGVIRGATCFIAGAVRDGPMALEDYGYVFEWALLHATDIGLGTCWLGGTFKRDRFCQAIAASSDEVVPAVSPVGHVRSRRSVVDSVFRWAAASKKRKPWSELFFEGSLSTPLAEQAAGDYATVLEMVRLGPSASNKQPWRLVRELDGDLPRFHLLLQRSPGYRTKFTVDLQRLDMGIAMCHFELTARELGLEGAWRAERPDLGQLPEGTSYVATWS